MNIVESALVCEGEHDLLFQREIKRNSTRHKLGRNLRCVRRLQGLSIREVANAAGMHETDLNKMERGHRWPIPKYQTLLRVCGVLRIDLKSLLDRDLTQVALDAIGVKKE